MGFPEVDIDVDEIFESLSPGYYMSVICEGCGLLAIEKTGDNQLRVAYDGEDGFLKWETEYTENSLNRFNNGSL
jgi:hypothetical protein